MRCIPLSAVAVIALLQAGCASRTHIAHTQPAGVSWQFDRGGIIRGDVASRNLAMIFTADEHSEGATHILDVLKERRAKASFFLTGNYVRNAAFRDYIRRMTAEGHYVGPHSDRHLLYCPWEDRDRSLVSEEEFRADVSLNIEALLHAGALLTDGPVFFIPPYEWYNAQHAAWAREMDVVLFNFTPGSGSNRDYMPEGHPRFVSSQRIMEDILVYERKDPHGLNGFILLLHLGADRRDKMFLLLGPLMQELEARGYAFVRIDALLSGG